MNISQYDIVYWALVVALGWAFLQWLQARKRARLAVLEASPRKVFTGEVVSILPAYIHVSSPTFTVPVPAVLCIKGINADAGREFHVRQTALRYPSQFDFFTEGDQITVIHPEALTDRDRDLPVVELR